MSEFDEIQNIMRILGMPMRRSVVDELFEGSMSDAVKNFSETLLKRVASTGQFNREEMIQLNTPSVSLAMNTKYAPGANGTKPGPSPAQVQAHIAVWLHDHPEVEAEMQKDFENTIYQEYYFTEEGGNKSIGENDDRLNPFRGMF